MSIKIIIDSASDINSKEALDLGVEMLPMEVSFGEEVFYDGVNLSSDEFYKKLITSKMFPKTSQITPYRYTEKIEELVKLGHDVIIITISSKLSATYSSALNASKDYEGKVFVVDSLNATSGEKLLVLYALQLVKEGYTVTDIVDKLNIMKEKIVVFACVDTLEYLKKGGRISSTAAFAGELLSLKPILSIIDGEVKVVNKAIGSRRAYKALDQLIDDTIVDTNLPYCYLYSGNNNSNLNKYIELTQHKDKFITCNINQIGSTIGTHVGCGAVGVVYFKK